MKKLVFLFSILFIGRAYALGLEEVTLKELSTTGRSLTLDRGLLEHFEEGSFGQFFVQKGPKESPKLFLVAEGELVKSFPRKSFWLLRDIYIPNGIKANTKLFLLPSNKLTIGRPLKIKERQVVKSAEDYGDLDDFIDKNKENVPSRLVKESGPFIPSEDIFEKIEVRDDTQDSDVVVTNYEDFKNKSGNYYSEEYGDLTNQRFYIDNKEYKIGDIRKAEDKKLFDSMSEGYVKKTNSMKYGVTSFYSEQEKVKELPELSVKGSQASTFDEVKYARKEKSIVSPSVAAKYKRDGEQWSSDLNDEDLRTYFIKTGMEKEIRRREVALNELDGHELMLHFSNGISAHGNTTDPNYQGRGYNIGISYDLHLSRTSLGYKNWSLQFIFESGVLDYDTGVYNARSEEKTYGFYLNYYFYNNPTTLNSFIYLAGVGLKGGRADLSGPDISKEYSYQVLTLPSLQLMTKYRFRAGDVNEDNVNIGASLNFGVNLDMKNLSVIDKVEDDINSKISVSDLKYTVGMSFYF